MPVSAYLEASTSLQGSRSSIPGRDVRDAAGEEHHDDFATLLSHTSGIGYSFTTPSNTRSSRDEEGEWELPPARRARDANGITPASTRRSFRPWVVEKITKSQLEPWYQDHIFTPLAWSILRRMPSRRTNSRGSRRSSRA